MNNHFLRYDERNHVSVNFLNDEYVRIVRLRCHSRYDPPAEIVPYLKFAGFGYLTNICHFTLNPALICALLERWRPETHTFHFHTGETAPTLEDVALHLGLPIDGEAVTGFGSGQNWYELCTRCLGVAPPPSILKGGKGQIKFIWLKETFETIPAGATDQFILCAARAWILHLIGAVLMPDTTGNLVHLMYLSLLEDFSHVPTFSWGSAVLAFLYREMCNACEKKYAGIGGCLPLLQSWAYYRMPFLRPIQNNLPPTTFPVINRWNFPPRYQGRNTLLQTYRGILDTFNANEFVWMPYNSQSLIIPEEILADRNLWRVSSAIICFCTVEWQQGDRVMRQFGFQQDIPITPADLDKLHDQDMRGHPDQNWKAVRSEWISIWNTRWNRIPGGIYVGQGCGATNDYMGHFMHFGKPYLLPRNAPISVRFPERRRPPLRPRPRSDEGENVGSTSAPPVQFSSQFTAPISVDLNVPLPHGSYGNTTEEYRPVMPGESSHQSQFCEGYGGPMSFTDELMPSFEELMSMPIFNSPVNTDFVQENDNTWANDEQTPEQRPQRTRRQPNRFTPRTTPSNHRM